MHLNPKVIATIVQIVRDKPGIQLWEITQKLIADPKLESLTKKG